MAGSFPKQRLIELDGLRGFALVMILAFHAVSQEGEYPAGTFLAYLQRSVAMGWTALDLFFILSGFLIGGILMDARDSPSYFKTFYARRFFRIVPVYFAWVLLYVLLVTFAADEVVKFSNTGLRPPLNFSVWSHFLFLQNSFNLRLYGLSGAWFGHLWSLAVEEQFYLVAPLVVRLIPPRHLKWILGTIVLLAILARIYFRFILHVPVTSITTRTVCRMDALAVGVLAAILVRSETGRRWLDRHLRELRFLLVALAVGVVMFFLFSYGSINRGMQSIGFTWMAAFYAVVLLLAVQNRVGWLARFLRNPLLLELGSVSYCVYLIHLVVNVSLHALLLRQPPRISTLSGILITLLALLIAYAIAKLSWIYFEGPLHRRGQAFKY
ncbi:MAG TPA: acyltransferase [Candidatus Eisenbacteria bacterium]|jgi:peptidoglycan/LPS O-acetylase OafA/YrhL|nr:acyltransferase [Candidatus Eisenbacteria bacterium]